MAENKTKRISDIEQAIKQFPGPYVGYVKNPTDVNRMGRLFVHIPELHGEYDETNKQQSAQTVPCQYCSPFAGQTPLTDTSQDPREFANTQKSYGFWMVPPDINTKVLVVFANGNTNQAYWIGCIFDDYMNHMTPGVASSERFVGNSDQNSRYFDELNLSKAPVAEAQRRAESNNVARINTKAREDIAFTTRPIHVPQTETLVNQGLISDDVRGTTTSSARRETPSQVFGISTPGPIDFEGQKISNRESINRHGKIYNNASDEFDFTRVAHSRLGGHSFVMDDGTPRFREGNNDKTTIENELIRLRTRSGAQVLLHNSKDVVYIINNLGTAWIEFTQDGKIDVYAKDSVSIHTEADMNFRAERDINLEAGRNVNIKATGENTSTDQTTGRVHIDANTNYELVIGQDGLITAGANIKTYAVTDFNVNTGNEIHLDTAAKLDTNLTASLSTHTASGKTSIMKRIPTQEPWQDHEDKKRDDVTTAKTDREQS